MSNQRVHNPVGTEVVYDSAGHILPGFTSTVAYDLSDPVTARLTGSGRLLVVSDPKPAPKAEPEPDTKTSTRKRGTATTGTDVSGDNESGETS